MAERVQRCLVIAEAGVNHNGSLDLALKLIDAAVAAGADIVKFQTFRAGAIVSRYAPKADYQINTTGAGETQLYMVRRLELSHNDHVALMGHCAARGIGFLSAPFDISSARFLANVLGLRQIKIPSGELTNGPLLVEVARLGCELILSTGMATLAEIEDALGALAFGLLASPEQPPSRQTFRSFFVSEEGQTALRNKLTLLHCTTEYPAPFAEVNLAAMDTLRNAFGLPVGFSDHTEGIAIPVAAVARGAAVVEKHFTLDRSLPGPDHRASLEPPELAAMVTGIRQVEMALGDGRKRPSASEIRNTAIARKSLIAAKAIRAGEVFTPENLTAKRPGIGISPMDYWAWLGRCASRDFSEDEPIE